MTDSKKIFTFNALREAFLSFLASVIWPRGYMVKKYQDLLFLIKWKDAEGRQMAWHGGYEKKQTSFLLSCMSKGCNAFFDIGANFGLCSLQVAKSGRAAAVHAFEPDPGRFAHMEGNLYPARRSSISSRPTAAVDNKRLQGTIDMDVVFLRSI